MTPNELVWTPTLEQEDLDHVLHHTSQLWEELRNQHLFMTGGTGFFGHWLLESLLWANDTLNLNVNITLLSRNPQAFSDKYPQLSNHPAITWIEGDVKTFNYPEGNFPYIIHAASEGDAKLAQKNPLLVFDTIFNGTRHVLDFARMHDTRKLLFTSSGAVYGKQAPEMTYIPEDYMGGPDVRNPLSAYGEGKRTAEMLCNLYSHQYSFETKVARCFAFVGPYLHLDANYAIGNFIRDALHGGPIVIKGDGTPYRSYLYGADLAIWLWTILVRGENYSSYNVGSDEAFTIEEIAQHVAAQFPHRPRIKIQCNTDPSKPHERYLPEVYKAKTELGLDVWILLDTAIQKTLKYYRKNI